MHTRLASFASLLGPRASSDEGRALNRSALWAPAITLALAVLATAPEARAAGPLGPEGSPITTSSYTIDFFTGPVVSSARVTALGGAFSGIAEGVDADPINVAAPAIRVPWSYSWFDYDVTLGVSLPGIFSYSDFENAGDGGYRYDPFYVPSAGLNLLFGRTALGVYADNRRYSLSLEADGDQEKESFAASFYNVHVLLARAFWRGQLAAGLGMRIISFDLENQATRAKRLSLSGVGAETGVLLAPTGCRWRLGVTARLPVSAVPSAGDLQPDEKGDLIGPGGFYLPKSVQLPWEVEAGFAIDLGERPLNPEWANPTEYDRALRAEISRARSIRSAKALPRGEERKLRLEEEERLDSHLDDLYDRRKLAFRQMSRRRFLLTGSVLLSGAVGDAVGTLSMLQQTVARSGVSVSVTPRLGLEAEPLPHWLQLRMGGYLEPSRLVEASSRLHFTTGFDVKVLPWSVFGLYSEGTWWSVGAVLDVAKRYTNLSFRLGVWH
ncbi:MAG: hypothetical protein HY901_38265 [Deltaproteobacteria bacterium]|nr:hypothetical protein [Deltaproteobacteria bacterium]